MADIKTARERSENMSRIKGKNTKIEILVRKRLFALGLRFRINVSTLPGKPDIVFKKYKSVIFVNGCYWHGHDCKDGHLPKSNVAFWKEKIEKNIERDKRNYQLLKNMGWNVIIVWECELSFLEGAIERIRSNLFSQKENCN